MQAKCERTESQSISKKDPQSPPASQESPIHVEMTVKNTDTWLAGDTTNAWFGQEPTCQEPTSLRASSANAVDR